MSLITLQTSLHEYIEDSFPSNGVLVLPIVERFLAGRPIKCYLHYLAIFRR